MKDGQTERVPTVRFKGFTGEWDEKELGAILEEYNDQCEKDGSYPHVSLTKEGVVPKSARYDRDALVRHEDKKYRITHKDDICYNPANLKFGVICRNTLGDGIFSPIYITFRVNESNDPVFIEGLVRRDCFIQESLQWQEGTVYERKAVKPEKLLGMPVSVPSKAEQEKIGAAFEKLDQLIALHRRKVEKLTEAKKALLVKLFPSEGETVPALRFAGFTGEWEQKKLEAFLAVSSKKNVNDVYGKADVLSVSGDCGIVNQIEFMGRSFAGASVSNYGVVHTGDVVYTKSPLNSNPYGIIKANKGPDGIVSTLYAVYRPKEGTDPNFVQLYFDLNSRMNTYMHPLVNKGAKNDMKVSAANALKGPVCFPSIKEQEKIGKTFAALDRLIALHRRKVEKLTDAKKALLHKLFPREKGEKAHG